MEKWGLGLPILPLSTYNWLDKCAKLTQGREDKILTNVAGETRHLQNNKPKQKSHTYIYK